MRDSTQVLQQMRSTTGSCTLLIQQCAHHHRLSTCHHDTCSRCHWHEAGSLEDKILDHLYDQVTHASDTSIRHVTQACDSQFWVEVVLLT